MSEIVAFSHTQGLDPQASHTHTPTLRAEGAGMAVMVNEPLVFDGLNQSADDSGVHRTLRIGQDSGDCVFVKSTRPQSSDHPEVWRPENVAPTLNAFDNTGDTRATVAITTAQVRRLTCEECERLQGWPDDHTRWRADGTENSDSTRYRMIGNGVAAPVAQWLAERITQLWDTRQ